MRKRERESEIKIDRETEKNYDKEKKVYKLQIIYDLFMVRATSALFIADRKLADFAQVISLQ